MMWLRHPHDENDTTNFSVVVIGNTSGVGEVMEREG
jgi:hypothetical protein